MTKISLRLPAHDLARFDAGDRLRITSRIISQSDEPGIYEVELEVERIDDRPPETDLDRIRWVLP